MKSFKQLRESEPVRVWVYPILLVILGIAVKEGYVTNELDSLVQLVLASLLGIGAVEGVRGRVSPVRPAQHVLVNPEPGYEIRGRHYDDDGDGVADQYGGAHAVTDQIPVVDEER